VSFRWGKLRQCFLHILIFERKVCIAKRMYKFKYIDLSIILPVVVQTQSYGY